MGPLSIPAPHGQNLAPTCDKEGDGIVHLLILPTQRKDIILDVAQGLIEFLLDVSERKTCHFLQHTRKEPEPKIARLSATVRRRILRKRLRRRGYLYIAPERYSWAVRVRYILTGCQVR